MARITLTWPGGEHEFVLSLGALRALQTQCNAGPGEIMHRLESGLWRVDDIIGVLRHGLEGGGLPKAEARELIEAVADDVGLRRLVVPAFLVMGAALSGEKEDPPGEPQGVSPTDRNGASANSTGQGPLLDSPPAT